LHTPATTDGHAARHCISVLSAHVNPSFGSPRGRIVRSTVFSLVIRASVLPISALAALGCVALGSSLALPRCTNLPISSSSSDLPAATPRCVPLSFDGLDICPAFLAPPCSCPALRARVRAPSLFLRKTSFSKIWQSVVPSSGYAADNSDTVGCSCACACACCPCVCVCVCVVRTHLYRGYYTPMGCRCHSSIRLVLWFRTRGISCSTDTTSSVCQPTADCV
jgi:hypothetical protein